MILVVIDSVTFDPQSSLYRVALKDERTGKVLPIYVGTFEGNAISIGMRNLPTVRPLTHDLMKNVIERLYGRVTKVVITDLRENIYYAYIYMVMDDSEIAVDSRPSDAIALATRVKVPIYVADHLADKFVDELEEVLSTIDPGETIH
jgi:bifunctional DNase/RNase